MAFRNLSNLNLELLRTSEFPRLMALAAFAHPSSSQLSSTPHARRIHHFAQVQPQTQRKQLNSSVDWRTSHSASWSVLRRHFRTTAPHPAKDWYKILGVPRDADAKVIKQAYFKMAKKYHPDSHPNDKNAKERFQEIAEAYDVLSDDDKKREYDLSSDFFNPRSSKAGEDSHDGTCLLSWIFLLWSPFFFLSLFILVFFPSLPGPSAELSDFVKLFLHN